jgi:hypothetical protein
MNVSPQGDGMIALTGSHSLPLIRLARHGRQDLVFQGEMLARGDALQKTPPWHSVSLTLYKSLPGKFVLSISKPASSPTASFCRPPTALCFSCLADVWEYLGTEHPGMESMLEPYLSQTSFPRYAQERFCGVHRTFPQNCTRDCARCAESCNCAGRTYVQADGVHFRRSCP